MNRTKVIKVNSQNLNQFKQHTQHYCICCSSDDDDHCCVEWQTLRQNVVVAPVETNNGNNDRKPLVCIKTTRAQSYKHDRLSQHLKLISLATVSLLLLSSSNNNNNNRFSRPSSVALGQEIAEVNSRSQQQAGDDDELSKTLVDRPNEEEAREAGNGNSVVLLTSPSKSAEDELSGRDREHSMSIWSPDEHHRLTSEEDFDQFAIQKQKQHDDEEMAGASELNHHFISVLNNQSNIVYSSDNNNANQTTPVNQSANKAQASTQLHQQQPFATTFLLGNDNKSTDTRTVLSVNWKQQQQEASHQNNDIKHQSEYGSEYQDSQSSLPEQAGLQMELNNTAQRESTTGDNIGNKADQQSTPVRQKQEFRKKKRKKKAHRKINNVEAESRQLSSTVRLNAQLPTSTVTPLMAPARMISYRPRGQTEASLKISPSHSNSSKHLDEKPPRLLQLMAAGKHFQPTKDSLTTLGSSASGRLIIPGARFLQQQPQFSSASDLLPPTGYLDTSTISPASSLAGTTLSTVPSVQYQSSPSPFEFKKLLKEANKPSPLMLGDFLIAAGSHAANEFETTLKQQPQHQQEPIVTHLDTGSASAVDAHGGLESSSSSSILTPSDLSDEDDGDADQDPFEVSGVGGASKGDSSMSDQNEMDEQMRDKPLRAKQTSPSAHKEAQASDSQQQQQQQQKPSHQPSASHSSSGQTGGATQTMLREPEHELLVGPFKSESEAPATITLSGIVYQKSGSSSSFLESRAPTGLSGGNNELDQQRQQQQDKLATSGSSSLSSAKLSYSGNQGLSGQQSNKAEPQQQVRQTPGELPAAADKYAATTTTTTPQGWLPNQPMAATQLSSASINDILLNLMKSNQEQQLAMAQADQLDSTTSNVLNQLASEQPGYLASGGGGGLRLATFGPLSGASSLLSNSLMSQPTSNQFQASSSSQLDELLLGVNPTPKLISANQLKGKDYAATLSDLSGLSSSAGSIKSASSSLAPEQVWAGKKGEKYYLGGALSAASSDSHHHHSKHKDKGPIVIVQKDVKPVKYHLMRAYLKLRRLLRPFEATYVFLNDSHTSGYSVKRRHRRSGGRLPQPQLQPQPQPQRNNNQQMSPQQQQSNSLQMPMPMPNASGSSPSSSSSSSSSP